PPFATYASMLIQAKERATGAKRAAVSRRTHHNVGMKRVNCQARFGISPIEAALEGVDDFELPFVLAGFGRRQRVYGPVAQATENGCDEKNLTDRMEGKPAGWIGAVRASELMEHFERRRRSRSAYGNSTERGSKEPAE